MAWLAQVLTIRAVTAALVLTLLLGFGVGASLGGALQQARAGEELLSISVSESEGINRYVMVEVDDGDNDERQEVTLTQHVFVFEAVGGAGGLLTWDFGDGSTAVGASVQHAFEEAGLHEVHVSEAGGDAQVARIGVMVHLEGAVESDNMECTCAPTAKSTLVDLHVIDAPVSIAGQVHVEHEGSSESCSLRNPLQECHIRVLLETVEAGDVILQEALHDATFRENELVIPFDLGTVDLEEGQTLRLRLETDQLRDWHKPNTTWTMLV